METSLVKVDSHPIHAEWCPGEITPHLERCRKSNVKFLDWKTFAALKRLDWKQLFNWVGEEAPIGSYNNKGWKKKIAVRTARIQQMSEAGMVKPPTDVASKAGDGLDEHSVENILKAVKRGIAYTGLDVSGKSKEQPSPVAQVALELQVDLPPSTALGSADTWRPPPGLAPPQGVVVCPPPPSTPPPRAIPWNW